MLAHFTVAIYYMLMTHDACRAFPTNVAAMKLQRGREAVM